MPATQLMPPVSSEHTAAFRVLILNSANWEGLSRLPYLLRQASCTVDVIAPRRNFIAHSSWVSRLIVVDENTQTMVKQLRKMFSGQAVRYDWVIVGDDPLLYALSRLRREAWVASLLPCPPQDRHIDFMVSKRHFAERAATAGLPMPEFRLCATREELLMAAKQLHLPLVVKENEGFGGLSVRIVRDVTELADISLTEPVIAQAFVQGQVCSAAVLFDQGKLVGFFSYLRKRTRGSIGASTAVEFKVFPELADMLARLGQLSGYHGLCGVDFIEEQASGRLYLLEQNFRPTLTMLLGQHVGVDLVKAIRLQLIERAGTNCAAQDPAVRDVIPLFPGEILRIIEDRDMRGLLRCVLSRKAWIAMGWHDRGLLVHNIGFIANFAGHKLGRMWHKVRERSKPARGTPRPTVLGNSPMESDDRTGQPTRN
jgi:predicted ATP-grasp superfamily ATP-dependent carboligase